jgi:hypothetical protein
MKITLSILLLASLHLASFAQKADTRYFELRTYYCNPGRLDALIERFRNHTIALFEKHGMENIGYWLPTDNKDNALYYVLAYPSKVGRDTSWKAFLNDPVWKEAAAKSEESGKIVAKVTSVFMTAAEFSPAIQASKSGADRTFELRTYYCFPGKMPNLQQRFTNHTMKLFTKHNITNIAYWNAVDSAGNPPSKLVYMIAYPNGNDPKTLWQAFATDPVWLKAKEESEKDGKIVEKVESVFLKPLDYSKIK